MQKFSLVTSVVAEFYCEITLFNCSGKFAKIFKRLNQEHVGIKIALFSRERLSAQLFAVKISLLFV